MEEVVKTDIVLKKENYKVSGMTCASCAISLESHLKPIEGIKSISVNYPNQSASIEFDADLISFEEFQQKAKEISYEIIADEGQKTEQIFEEKEEQRLKTLKSKLIFAALFSIPVFVISMFFMGKLPYENWILLALSLPVLFWSGSEFFVIAWKKLKHFSSNMDTLVALSTGVAFIFSLFNTVNPQYFLSQGVAPHVYYESAVVIITLILLGRYLEEKAKSKTSSAIKKLMGLNPKQVTVIKNGEEEIIPFEEIAKGDLIVLKPGDKIPVDGKVKKGESFVDESMITGEPIPVLKTKGANVTAGTINQKGALRILAKKVGNETMLSQIIELVKNAQASKPKIQKLVDKIAGIFVPVVIVIAIITFLLWYFFGPDPTFTYAILSLITVLIIACPCALGLATPTALMVGIGKGAEQGILIKDAQALETAYKVDVLIVDKTGTLTEGKPQVTDFVWGKDVADPKYLQEVILSIESQSEHPIAEAIVTDLQNKNTSKISSRNFESITGMGAKTNVKGQDYWMGNDRLMAAHDIDIPQDLRSKADALKLKTKTVVYFGDDKNVKAIIAVADQIKATTVAAITNIQEMGIEVHMLTGDNAQTAAVIADKVGIKKYRADVMPADKGAYVMDLQKLGKVVAMAGDGINDANALAQSDVGIAMGSGTDIAMNSAGITLMNSDLNQIGKAIKLSKATMKTIRQNLFWAFIYNIIALPIAAGVLYPAFGFLLNPMIAGGAMAMSSISVVSNSLRLKRVSL